MRRISVDEVKAAYEKTGLAPDRADYITRDHEGCPYAACGVGVVAIASGCDATYTVIRRWAVNEYGHPYVESFVAGFDGDEPIKDLYIEEGYEDGRAAAIAIFGEVSP